MFIFTPLLGAQSESIASQSLLEFDGGVRILINVGWDTSFDAAKLRALERYDTFRVSQEEHLLIVQVVKSPRYPSFS